MTSVAPTPSADPDLRALTDVGIFDLSRAAPPPREWPLSVPLVALVLIGTIAFVGQYRPNQVSRALAAIGQLRSMVAACTVLAAAAGVLCIIIRRRALAVLAFGIVGYFVGAAGIACGLWVQGMCFGLLHWGASVGVLAALPTSLLIGIGSVFWGKAVLETKGLSWVIVSHALIDVAIMSAYFVPKSAA